LSLPTGFSSIQVVALMLELFHCIGLTALLTSSAHAFTVMRIFSAGVVSYQGLRSTSVMARNEGARSWERDMQTQKWDVNRYQGQHSFVWEFGSSLVETLNPRPGERILDLGCGSGELTNEIAMSYGNESISVVGMDASLAMIEKAKNQFPHLGFFQGDGRDFMVDEPFDAIFSNAALHWIPGDEAESAVIAISRALKPGGRFVAEFGGKGNIQKIEQALVENTGPSPWYFPSISEYSLLLERHGIEVLSADLYDRPTPLENGDQGIKNWIRMFGNSFFQGRSEEEVENLLEKIEDKLRPDLFDGAIWTADYRRIRVVGKRVA